MRSPADVEPFRPAAIARVGANAPRHAGRQSHRPGNLLRIKPSQPARRGRGRDRPDNSRCMHIPGMKAPAGDSANSRGDLVSDRNGGAKIRSRCTRHLGDRDCRGNDHASGMHHRIGERVVEVMTMCRNAVNERGSACGQPLRRTDHGTLRNTAEGLRKDTRGPDRLGCRAGNDEAHRIEHAQGHEPRHLGGNIVLRQVRAPFRKLSRDRLHGVQCSAIARFACATVPLGVR